MPAYNCEKYIRQAIESILNQSYTNFELLISDDCSTDNTKQIIDSYNDSRIRKFHNEVNLGYLKSSNNLVQFAKGVFITFQDADDYSDLNRLELQVAFLDSNKEIDCVGSNIIKIDTEGKLLYQSNYFTQHDDIKNAFESYKIVMTGSALMVRKRVIDKLGLYNIFFDRVGSEDIYWYSQILKEYKVSNLHEPLYFYRTNPNSISLSHENPKSLVGHDLVLFMYNRTVNGATDLIAAGEYEALKTYEFFLILIKKIPQGKFKAFIKYFIEAFNSPLIAIEFFRPFFSKLLRN